MTKLKPTKLALYLVIVTIILLESIGTCYAIITVEDIVELTLRHNRNIKRAKQLLKKATFDFKSQVASVMPNVSFSGRISKTNGMSTYHNIGITLTQPIDASGRISDTLKLANLQVKIAEANLLEIRRNIVFRAKSTFYRVLLDKSLIKVEELHLQSLKERYKIISEKYKKGMVSYHDLIRAKVDLSNAYPHYITLKNNLKSDINSLTLLAGKNIRNSKLPERLTYTLHTIPPEPLIEKKALKNRPDLLLARLNEAAAKLTLLLKEKENSPQLSFLANFVLHSSVSKENHNFTLSLNLSFPIYDSNKRDLDVKSQKAYLKSILLAKEQLIEEIKNEVKDAYNGIKKAESTIKAIKGNIQQAKLGLKIATTRYKEGLSTYLDLMNSELALHTARVNMSEAIYSYFVSIANLKLVEGETR
ncbi:MAG: TolC family protein [Synergistetes bacterium]|nr:TolC family protein [Synergistota bacterium]